MMSYKSDKHLTTIIITHNQNDDGKSNLKVRANAVYWLPQRGEMKKRSRAPEKAGMISQHEFGTKDTALSSIQNEQYAMPTTHVSAAGSK